MTLARVKGNQMLETPSIQLYQPKGGDNESGADNQQERPDGDRESSETITLPYDPSKLPVRDIAYMAGIIDGEGCISGHWNNNHPFVYVKVTNTDYRLMDWIVPRFGGRVLKKGGKVPDNWRQSWDWYANSTELMPFLTTITPFLVMKQKQAYKAMAIRSCVLKKSDRTRLSDAIAELKEMNRRGR